MRTSTEKVLPSQAKWVGMNTNVMRKVPTKCKCWGETELE